VSISISILNIILHYILQHHNIKRRWIRHLLTPDSVSVDDMNDQASHSGTTNDSSSIPAASPNPAVSAPIPATPSAPQPCPNLRLHLSQSEAASSCCVRGLPPELQVSIFKAMARVFTSQHRFIQLRFGPDRELLIANTTNPSPLSICRTTRLEALRSYVRIDEPGAWANNGVNDHMESVYIYPAKDTITFCPVQDFGAEGGGDWGVYRDPVYQSITLYGSGLRELDFYLNTALLLNLSRDDKIISLALRPGEAPICESGPHCRCAKRFHAHWGMWSYWLRRFLALKRLIIFHEYHSPSQTSHGHPIPDWRTIPKFTDGLRDCAVENSYRWVAAQHVPDIRVVDSRCMPAPGEHFELTGDNLTAKRLRSLGNEWRVTVPDIPDTQAQG